MFTTINPATGQDLEQHAQLNDQQLEEKLALSAHAWEGWKQQSFSQRGACFMKLARLIEMQADELARLMAHEMGKPLAQGLAELKKCVWVCEYYAQEAEGMLSEQIVEASAQKSKIVCAPLGPILAIMPWNFPFWQVLRFAAPTLMAGNVGLLKHAPCVFGCAQAIEELFQAAGFPDGVMQNLVIDEAQAGQVIADFRVRGVSLTGSDRAGRSVGAQAGAALKSCVLELGGSDPYVVFDDADVELAVDCIAKSRLFNAGQICIAAKRVIVTPKVAKQVIAGLKAAFELVVQGDPLEAETTMGPMAREDLRQALHAQVQASIDAGARCVLGGELPEGAGSFYPPTLLLSVETGMAAYDEELFGPVGIVIEAKDEADAIRIANDTRFGLSGAVFTQDRVRGEAIASQDIEAGCVFVNSMVGSDPRLPFGGIKDSGFGRELAQPGIHAFVNTKTVCVD